MATQKHDMTAKFIKRSWSCRLFPDLERQSAFIQLVKPAKLHNLQLVSNAAFYIEACWLFNSEGNRNWQVLYKRQPTVCSPRQKQITPAA